MTRSTLITFALLLGLTTAAQAEERKVVAERADCSISVGDRDADGNNLVLADCTWPIAPEKVIAAVADVEAHARVLSSVKESTRLPDGRVLQIHVASGISDRQITLDFTDEKRPDGSFKTSWTRSAKQEPLREDMVDAPLDDGSWEVIPVSATESKVNYSLRYDPGGRVPTWIVRAFQKGGIADIVEEMRSEAEGR